MAKKDGSVAEKVISKNRRAFHEFNIEDRLEAGVALVGSEVKSCRHGSVSLQDAYVQVQNGEAFLVNSHISEYGPANRFNHSPTRLRKLLLHRREIDKLEVRLRQQGQSAVPIALFFKNGRVKVDVGIGKGKTFVDRRDVVREREMKREVDRAMRRRRRR